MIENLLQEAEQAKSSGDDKKAIQIYRQIIEICENEEGQSPQLAYCLQEVAQIFSAHGQFSDAIPFYKRLIALGEKILSADHPDIINAGVNLARTYEANGQSDLADQEYKAAAGKAEKAFGIAHPMAQEIRQEYFDAVANRQVVQGDKLRHGLTLERASQNYPSSAVVEQSGAKEDSAKPLKKYLSLTQSTKIKKLRYVAESVEAQASNLLKAHGLRRHSREIFYFVSVILCIVAIFIAFSKLFVPNELPASNLIAQRLIGKVFRSVDGFDGIQFIDNRYAVLSNDVHHRKISYVLLKGGLRDLKDMVLSMLVHKEYWYQLNGDELTSEDGNVFYEGNAPEVFLVAKMKTLAEFARSYYAKNGCYPDRADKLKSEPGLSYMDPFGDKAEVPTIKRLSASYARDAIFPGIKVEANANECYWFLRHGGTWSDDLTDSIGKISALALFTSQRCADGYKVNEFYVHAFDRHGRLISAGKPETSFVIGLYAGRDINDDNHERAVETERASVHPPEKIYISPGDIVDVHFWRQFLSALLVGAVILSFIVWLILEAKNRRENPTSPLQPVEFVFIVCLSIWAYVGVIHLIP